MLSKQKLLIVLVAVSICSLIYVIASPYFSAKSILTAIVAEDTAVLDTKIDFSQLIPSLKREYKNYSLTSDLAKNQKQDFKFASDISESLTKDVTASADLLKMVPFTTLQFRKDFLSTELRYLDFNTYEMKLTDTQRPFLLPTFILCRSGLASWKICRTSFDSNLALVSVLSQENLELLDNVANNKRFTDFQLPKDFFFVPLDKLPPFTLSEFYNVLTTALPRKDAYISYDTENKGPPSIVVTTGAERNKYTFKNRLYDTDSKTDILVLNSVSLDNGTAVDCHACPAKLVAVTYQLKDGVIKITSNQSLGEYGVWGDIGAVGLALVDEQYGFGVINGSCWQGECSNWLDTFVVDKKPTKITFAKHYQIAD